MKALFAEQRRLRILEYIKEQGSARVRDLARIFSVTEPTIRQDLDKMDAEGLVVKEHGGAFLASLPSQVKSFALQRGENMDMKAAIARTAATFVAEGDAIILDSGSTVTELAKILVGRGSLTVITNALNIALILGAERGIEVLVTGGEFKPPTLSLTGEKAAAFFAEIHVSKLFLAAGGISPAGELTYPGLSDIAVKRAMIGAASEVFLLADSTKFGRGSLAVLGGLELADCLVTDAGIGDEQRRLCEARGLRVVAAEVPPRET